MTLSALIFVLCMGIATWLLVSYYGKRQRLPPGPAKIPILGNIHQMSQGNRFKLYEQFHERHGPIISLQIGMADMIVLGSHRVAQRLLGDKGARYSSRPRAVMADDLATKGMNMVLMPYGAKWQTHNRATVSLLNSRAVGCYEPVFDLQSRQLMCELLATNDFSPRLRRYIDALVLTLAYGKWVREEDEIRLEVDRIIDVATETLTVGISWIDQFPALLYLPRLVSPWKKTGDHIHRITQKVFDQLWKAGLESPSWNWSKKLHQACSSSSGTQSAGLYLAPEEQSYLMGVLLEGGTETSTTTLRNFFLAILIRPECAVRAQQELDAVVGSARMPELGDMEKLPYLNAMILEVLRWSPPTYTAQPHAGSEDGEIDGYYIPSQTPLLMNFRAMTLDKEYYSDPRKFLPERWPQQGKNNATKLPLPVFGYGRRACAGRLFALRGIYFAVSRLLWAFNVKPAPHLTADGLQFLVDNYVDHGATQEPPPFEVVIEPRSSQRRQHVEQAWKNTEAMDLDEILDEIGSKVDKL
ncbi:hypothetical protein CBS147371_8659 [Aspergillus niger]|nr:hypothetical protein CBS147371_8659 [Aspergillus niger]